MYYRLTTVVEVVKKKQSRYYLFFYQQPFQGPSAIVALLSVKFAKAKLSV